MANERKSLDREAVRSVIQQWNTNRLDLFALSEPDENLLFHGVMRFYFQDSGQKVATKCIRVASDATVSDVIDTLIEKFRPDMRMLSVPNYALYEVHANGEERRLNPDEKPLLVQLNWHVDDREGRFLLKNIDQKVALSQNADFDFKRKLSKREKKELKKKEKQGLRVDFKTEASQEKSANNNQDTLNGKNLKGKENTNGESQVAGKLYSELPETSFTRSISNPEAVMRRRRQQKLEKKLQQFRSRDGGPDTGGTLKIYGESLCKDVPYKTLLLSIRDCALAVVREMLYKYGLEKVDPLEYCLVQVNSDGTEYILDEDECPLSILMNHPTSRGSIMFHVRRRPADAPTRRRKKKPISTNGINNVNNERGGPMLMEITHTGERGRQIVLSSEPIEVGSANTNNLQLFGPSIQPRHCIITWTEGVCTVTPLHADALTFVNGHEVTQRTILHNGSVVMFGRVSSYRFVDSPPDGRYNLAFSQTQLDSPYLYESHSPASPSSWKDEDGTLSSTQKTDYDPNYTKYHEGMEHKFEETNMFGNSLDTETKSIASIKSSGGFNTQDKSAQLHDIEAEIQGHEAILPAVLEFPETHQEPFLQKITKELDVNSVPFKLAPAYALYLCARYRASTHYRPELQPIERANKLTLFLHHVSILIQEVVQEQYEDPNALAFWMANCSEFLHFLKSDRHICAFSTQAQDILAESVQTAFQHLVNCIETELVTHVNQFLNESLEHEMAASAILRTLGSVMVLLRRCRVNAALTIQLFSQLFHCINVTCFNKIISNTAMCTVQLGTCMSRRLEILELWAERQGLELAADCHLAKINQCAQFLVAPKTSIEEVQQLACSCFRLNSLQMAALLKNTDIPKNIVETAIRMAKSVADELAHADGRKIQLEEPLELKNALLLPDDGYSCDVVRGVPSGLVDFLNPLQQKNYCRLAAQPTSIGLWTVYMHDFFQNSNQNSMKKKLAQPDIQIIKLQKNSNGMGLSIVAAKGAGQERLGIYIKSVVSGGAAEMDGRLQAGDQLLRVDGQSLMGITQERAADYLVRTGPIVTLEVAKQGAIYHGLATLLQQPSPEINNDHQRFSENNLTITGPEADLKYKNQALNSKSVPALYHNPGKDFKFATHTKSRSINSLANNNNRSLNNENGFYQNLNVYSPQNTTHNEMERNFLETSMSNQHLYLPPMINTMASQPTIPQKMQHHQNSPTLSHMSDLQKTHSTHVLNDTNISTASGDHPHMGNMNKTLPYFQESSHIPANVDNSYANRYLNNQNSKSELQLQSCLRLQHQLGPSMPDISNFQNQPQFKPPVKQAPAPAPTPIQMPLAYQANNNFENSINAVTLDMHEMQLQHDMDLKKMKLTQNPNDDFIDISQENNNVLSTNYMSKQLSSYANQQQQQQQLQLQQQQQQQYHTVEKPPLPPTATHPLFKPQMAAHINYVASNLEPPKGGYFPSNNSQMLNQSQLSYLQKKNLGTNPWEREEREKEVEIRRGHVRKWRDQQIDELSSIQRTPQQEEQLKTLILERDFERRVQELEEQGDDTEPTFDKEQIDVSTSAIDHLQRTLTARNNELHITNTAENVKNFKKLLPTMPEEKMMCDDFMKTHTIHQSLSNNSLQPKSILKNNRNEITSSPSKGQKSTSFADQCIMHAEHHANFKQEEDFMQNPVVSVAAASATTIAGQMQTQKAEIIPMPESKNVHIEPPPPPERNSSFLLMSRQANRATTIPPPPPQPQQLLLLQQQQQQQQQHLNEAVNTLITPDTLLMQRKLQQQINNNNDGKHVSFQDQGTNLKISMPQLITYPTETSLSELQNNNVLFEVESKNLSGVSSNDESATMWNTTVQSTPGVIGAQEVYRDPRQRRLAEKEQQQQQRNDEAVPEKLSFKEKMKMFALETGENHSPKEKLKISKAQREIDEVQ